MRKIVLLLTLFSVVLCVGLKAEAATLEPFNQEKYNSIQEPVLKEMYKRIATQTLKGLPFGSSEKKIKAKAGVPSDQFSLNGYIISCYEGKESSTWIALKQGRMIAYMTMSTKSFTQERVQDILGRCELERLAGCIPALSYSSPAVQGNNVHVCWADDAMWLYVVGESKEACDTMLATPGAKAFGGGLS